MCIIDGKVNTISNTEILVGKLPSNKHQFTIYSNNINIDGLINNKNIGMILPFPKNGTKDGDIKLYDITDSKNIFDNLRVFSKNYKINKPFKYGNYEVSIVPSYKDFNNITFDRFNLSMGVRNILERDYSDDYGFVVCLLKNSSKFHPIVYSHRISSELFIPTKHYHNKSEEDIDWDHDIYILDNIKIPNYFYKNKGVSFHKRDINTDILGDFPFIKKNIKKSLTLISINEEYKNNHDILLNEES